MDGSDFRCERGVSEQWGKVMNNDFENDIYYALYKTNCELDAAISEINKMLMQKISSTDLQPPDYWDKETCHNNMILLEKAKDK